MNLLQIKSPSNTNIGPKLVFVCTLMEEIFTNQMVKNCKFREINFRNFEFLHKFRENFFH